MNSIELIDKKEQLKNQAEALLSKAQSEQRKLNEGEEFSLLKAINDVANNRQLDERSQEVVNQGVTEMRKAGLSYSGQIQLPVEERADV